MSSIFLLLTLPDLINELANQMSLFKEKKKKSTTKRENMYIECLFFFKSHRVTFKSRRIFSESVMLVKTSNMKHRQETKHNQFQFKFIAIN